MPLVLTTASSPWRKAFFERATFTASYVVCDLAMRAAAIIDPIVGL
jgi:hypothetical protein